MMQGSLHLRLALLRGEHSCPMDLADFGRPSRIEMRTQTKSALSDRIAVAMMEMIACGRLPPGTRLPPERAIADVLSASRVSVRKALARLKSDGYVQAVQGSGTRVVDDHAETLRRLILANRENIEDLGAFIAFFDRQLIGEAVTGAETGALRAVAAVLRRGGRADDPRGLVASTVEVRLALAECARNPIHLLVTDRLLRTMRRLFGSRVRGCGPNELAFIVSMRHDMAEALEQRDADGVGAALGRIEALFADLPHVGETSSDLSAQDIFGEMQVAGPEQLKTKLTREISNMIASADACDGGRMPSERRLALMFGVSRASVREALAELKSEGLVVADERCGTRISPICEDLTLLAGANIRNLKTLAELRAYLEVWAAGRAAQRASDGDLSDLRRILNEMRRPNLSAGRRIDLDMRLHLTIARAADSAVHLYITEILRDLMSAYFEYSLKNPLVAADRETELLHQHERIVDAICRRDGTAAREAMSGHCAAFLRTYRQLEKAGAA
jgi:DNA-binding FadR family transcriptional regulator